MTMKYSIGNSVTVSYILCKNHEQTGWLACWAPALRARLAKLKNTSAVFECPNIISQIWKKGSPSLHLSRIHVFWPACWRRCTALCLIQNILWKSHKYLTDRLCTPLAKKQIPLLLPPPSLLEKFNTKYHLWTRGRKTVREHTAIESKSKPALLDILLHSPPGQLTELTSPRPELCGGLAPPLGHAVTPVNTKLAECIRELYLRSCESSKVSWSRLPLCDHLKYNSTLHRLLRVERSLTG